jgi:serine/threonine protein kinase
MVDGDPDLRGQTIDTRFLVEDCIGRGGMGVVWRVRHLQTRQEFALKTIRGGQVLGRSAFRRLLHEARATAAVKSRHVVQVVDVKPDYVHQGTDLPYIVMELLDGQNLSQYLDEVENLSPEELVWTVRQVSKALSMAHARGIVHRDLKPSNIFLSQDEDGNVIVKVCDFGIAKLQGDAITELAGTGTVSSTAGELHGTPRYMAPEQLRRSGVEGPATDQWAFALIVFRCLTGRSYFEKSTTVAELVLAIVHDQLAIPSSLSPRFPKTLDDWFLRSCAREPAARFATIADQQVELERCLGELTPKAIALQGTLTNQGISGIGTPRVCGSVDDVQSWKELGGSERPSGWIHAVTLFLCLGISGGFSILGARWLVRHSSAHVRAEEGPIVAPGGPRTAPSTFTAPPKAMLAESLVTQPETELHSAGQMSMPGTRTALRARSGVRPTSVPPAESKHGARSPGQPSLLPQGAACSRSSQCEEGICAAEVCQ